jgi:hypothetical protein
MGTNTLPMAFMCDALTLQKRIHTHTHKRIYVYALVGFILIVKY